MSTRTDIANGLVTTRSYSLCIAGEYSFDDFVTTVAYPFAILPIGAVVVGGYFNVSTVWDITTSLVDLGDQVDIDEYSSTPDDLEVLGVTALTLTGIQVTTLINELNLIVTSTAPTTGEGDVFVEYVDLRKGDENFE